MSAQLPHIDERGRSWASPSYLYGTSRNPPEAAPITHDMYPKANTGRTVSGDDRSHARLVKEFMQSDRSADSKEQPAPWNDMLLSARSRSPGEAEPRLGSAAGSSRAGAQGNGGDDSAAAANKALRRQVVQSVDAFLSQSAASHVREPTRNANFRKGLEDIAKAYPNLSPILMQTCRYLRDLGLGHDAREKRHKQEMREQEEVLFKKYEEFFEHKIAALIKERNAMEAAAKQKYDEAFTLRKNRDEELTAIKADLMKRLNDCEKREDEFRSFRRLIASVFQTNEQLTNRIEDLEALLTRNRIEVPPAPNARELYAYSKAKSNTAAETHPENEVKPLSHQVPIEFIEASRAEMNAARLALQDELIYSAFDDRSAYRLQVNSLKNENNKLQSQVDLLKKQVTELNLYIHQRRFLYSSSGNGDGEVPMTPRPRDVPFGIQTDLGIDLRRSTSDIISELSAVAINLKHQLNSSMLRLRQVNTASEWMQEQTLLELDIERNEIGVLPTFKVKMWPNIPHFLRTHVEPDVGNLRWTEVQAGAIMCEFFDKYFELRKQCRYLRDSKMVQPRRHQLYERRELADLTPLDASKEDVTESEEAVPFGYVVSHFIHTFFLNLTVGTAAAELVLPGTLSSHFRSRGEEKVTEMEFARFAYNLWWCAQRYRHTQPLCRAFLAISDGHLPISVIGLMKRTLQKVGAEVRTQDVDGSHTFTFPRLIKGVLKMVEDMDAHAGRCASLALAQTFEANEISLLGGRITLVALLADESYTVHETFGAAAGGGGVAVTNNNSNNLPATITARYVPARTRQPLGSSVFHRYWQRLVLERVEQLYNFIERSVAPLVVESEVVVGLYLLPVPEALARVQHFDNDIALKQTELALGDAVPVFPGDSAAPPASATNVPGDDADAEDDASATNVAAEAQASVPSVTRNYSNLIEDRKQVWLRKRAAENMQLNTIVSSLLARLPRLNRSVHFPFQSVAAESPRRGGASAHMSPTKAGSPKHNKEDDGNDGNDGESTRPETAPLEDGRDSNNNSNTTATASVVATSTKGGGRKKKKAADAVNTAAASNGAGASGKKSKKSKKKEKAEPAESAVTLTDQEMVEWYGFCAELRRALPYMPEQLFTQPEAKETEDTEAQEKTD